MIKFGSSGLIFVGVLVCSSAGNLTERSNSMCNNDGQFKSRSCTEDGCTFMKDENAYVEWTFHVSKYKNRVNIFNTRF